MSVRCIDHVWRESAHSGSHLLMLLALADFSDDDGNSYPAVATLARKCRMQPRNAIYILKALQASGELQVRKNEGPRGQNRYRIVLKALQSAAGVQSAAEVQRIASTPAMDCAKPLQSNADKPSMNQRTVTTKGNHPRVSAADLPEWMPKEAWKSFCEMRRSKRKPVTPAAMKLLISKLGKLRDEGQSPQKVLEQSIENSWTGLFPVHERTTTRKASVGKHSGFAELNYRDEETNDGGF